MPDGTIVGRDAELGKLERFLDELPEEGGALVLEGEAGIGKTTLWREALAAAEQRSFRILRAQPAESETKLSYAALADLIGKAYDETRAELSAPQQRGLDAALLRGDSEEPADPRTIGTGLVSLLTGLAETAPVVVAIDDVQWLDRASERALAFAARRLPAKVGLLLARRSRQEASLPLGLDSAPLGRPAIRLEVGPLSLAALHHLLRSHLEGTPTRRTLVRLAAESGGNPFYALEIGRALGRENESRGPAEPLPLPEHLHDLVAARLRGLSRRAAEAVLAAAALSRPTIPLVVGALEDEGARAGLLEAEAAGVLELENTRVRFTHPLLASVVYGAASAERRRQLHRRLTQVVDDAEERGRHLSQSVLEPDEEIANELEQTARQAARRGAQDAAAELFEAAARLTLPQLREERTRRTIGGAAALLAVGDAARARSAADAAVEISPAGPIRGEALLLLSEIAWLEGLGLVQELLERALGEAGDDRRLRGRIHAKIAALAVSDQRRAVEHADAAAALLDEKQDPGLLAYVLATRLFFGAQVGLGARPELLARALELEERAGPDTERSSLFLIWFHSIDDFESARARHRVEDEWYAERGEEGWRAEKQAHRALVELRAGNWLLAEQLIEQSCTTLEQLGRTGPWAIPFQVRSAIDAHRGSIERARTTILPIVEAMERAGNAWFAALTLETAGFVELAAGDAVAADRAYARMNARLASVGIVCPVPMRPDPDHIEALVTLGDLDGARRELRVFETRARMLPRPWIAATLPRARALILAAEGDVRGALTGLEQAEKLELLPFELARTLLVQGQLERRLKQRQKAAESLGRSLELFEQLGAPVWADGARAELDRVGLRRGDPTELTATERRIAELAATGLTNRDIAQSAFVSPKTVEANLARAYRKLGIRSRAELGARMAERGPGVVPPPT